MKSTTKRRVIVAVAAVSLFAIYEVSTLIYTMIDDQETSSKIPLTEYNDLFSKKAQDQLQILATVKSRNRQPVSTYLYDKEYNLCVFKVIMSKNSGLTHILNYQNETTSKSLNSTYEGLPCFNFDMSIKAGKSALVSSIHFKSDGDSIKSIVRNDTLVCFYYKFNTFSINFNDEPYDIIAKADQSNIPASVIFKKNGKFVYIIILTVAKGKEELQPDQLYSIINKEKVK